MSTQKKQKPDRRAELDADIARLSKAAKLDGWAAFVRELDIPMDIYPAIASGRTELLAMIRPRDYSKEEMVKIFKLIAGLIETNVALREHAEQTSHLVDIWSDAFKQLESLGQRIKRFATFDHAEQEAEEES
jgi:hypothetical protein